MAEYNPGEDQDTIAELYRRIDLLREEITAMQAMGNIYTPRINPIAYPTPVEGQHAIDPADDTHMWYANGAWRKAGKIVREIKIFSDIQPVVVGDGAFIFEIPEDTDGKNLTDIETYVTTVSTSGKPTVQIRNITQAVDVLSTKCEIDVNEKNSKDAGTQPVINLANDDVAWGDHIAIDVDISGGGAMGLGAILTYG